MVGLNGSSEKVYPNAKVRVEKAQFSAVHLRRLIEVRKELILNPDFQRNNVWKHRQECELIESILMGIPLPIIYLFELPDGRKQVVDGRQRITAILKFLNNDLELRDLKMLPELNWKRFVELDSQMQGVFEDYQLQFYIIQPPTPERVKYDIFDRVNRGGTKLNNQEMRNALYGGKATALINGIAKADYFKKAVDGVSAKHMKDRYLVLRAIAFYLWRKFPDKIEAQNGRPIDYKSDIDDFLAKMMMFLNSNADDEIFHLCQEAMERSMKSCRKILGQDAFRFPPKDVRRRPINMPLFEMLMYLFANPEVAQRPKRAKQLVKQYKATNDYLTRFGGAVDATPNVIARYEDAEALLNEICQEEDPS